MAGLILWYLMCGLLVAEATLAFSRWNELPYSWLTYTIALVAWPWPVTLAVLDMMEKANGRDADKR